MQAYLNGTDRGRADSAPSPDMMSPVAMRSTIATLRAEVAASVEEVAAARRARDNHHRMVNIELAKAKRERDELAARLAAVREVLISALGGPDGRPKGATEVDLSKALAADLAYARRTTQQCHSRRRVTEAITERLLADVARLEEENEGLRDRVGEAATRLTNRHAEENGS